jgi:uncharacterized protein YaeQ
MQYAPPVRRAACDDARGFRESAMAAKATVYKAELSVSDMDRHYYATHQLTLAQHPSETEERLMVRLVAFALNAGEQLAFGRGISTEEEPDLWARDYTGAIDLWIEVGQPDEQRLRKACGRSKQVRVYCYSGRSAAVWWEKSSKDFERFANLQVFEVPAETTGQLGKLAARNMSLQCLVQDGHAQLIADDGTTVDLQLATLK